VPGVLRDGDLCVLCAGKAATSMAATIDQLRGSRIRAGLVIGAAPKHTTTLFESIPGSHPVPSTESERAGRRAIALAESLREDELLLVLLSGGASAMMAVPARGVTLEDKRRTTHLLLRAGADIYALNTVRKHLSDIKGGWLAAHTAGPSCTLAISDVITDDLSVIASGPTVADSSTFEDALEVLKRFGGLDAYPPAVSARLTAGRHGEVPETPKPGDPRLDRASATVIGSRRDAMRGAVRRAESLGYKVVQTEEPVVGEARTAALAQFRSVVAQAAGIRGPVCYVSSGETTVHVTGDGTGGRNQEFALALVEPLASLASPAAVASAGTDGIDGPTDAAGALADSTTLARAASAGLGEPDRYLSENDAYTYFAALGDLIKTGPTDTNVNDLQVILFS
jgi:hydroxypyruvate reductase